MKKQAFFLSILRLSSSYGFSQGCIPLRSVTGFGQYNFNNNAYSHSEWQSNFTNRYFKSFRKFKEKTDLKTLKSSPSAAIRYEGSPVYDLIGESDGARKAGYYLSVESGVIYKMRKTTLFAYMPVFVSRAIKQNVPAKSVSTITGVYTVIPGGSASYMMIAGISFKL